MTSNHQVPPEIASNTQFSMLCWNELHRTNNSPTMRFDCAFLILSKQKHRQSDRTDIWTVRSQTHESRKNVHRNLIEDSRRSSSSTYRQPLWSERKLGQSHDVPTICFERKTNVNMYHPSIFQSEHFPTQRWFNLEHFQNNSWATSKCSILKQKITKECFDQHLLKIQLPTQSANAASPGCAVRQPASSTTRWTPY